MLKSFIPTSHLGIGHVDFPVSELSPTGVLEYWSNGVLNKRPVPKTHAEI
jgi:hypothetical protein